MMSDETPRPGEDPHRLWAERIPELLRGELSAEERAELDAHLADCEECRELIATARDLRAAAGEGEEARDAHPEARLLDEYSRHPESLDEEVSAWVGAHLSACKACAEAAALAATDGPHTPGTRGRLSGLLTRTILHPVAAILYLAAALTLLPLALRGVPGDPAPARAIADRARLAEPAERLFSEQTLRGRSSAAKAPPSSVELAPGRDALRLELVTDLDILEWPEAGLRVRVAPERGTPLLDERLPRDVVGPSGVIALELPTELLSTGDVYRVQIREASGETAPLFEARFVPEPAGEPTAIQPDQ
jgi:hypothetical protein